MSVNWMETSTETLKGMYGVLGEDIKALIQERHPLAPGNHNQEVDKLSSLRSKIFQEIKARGVVMTENLGPLKAIYNGRLTTAQEMEYLARVTFALAGIDTGSSLPIVEENYVYMASFATVPGTWGHPQAEWSAKIMDGKWIVSRTGSLR